MRLPKKKASRKVPGKSGGKAKARAHEESAVVRPERILPFREFLRHFHDAHSNRGSKPPFCFILGAGASVQSGIPAAGTMVDEWLREMHTDAGSGEPWEKWATADNLGIPGFEW